MSSVGLLDKTRRIGKLLHYNNSSKVVFTDICSVVTEIMDSSALVISAKGKVLGASHRDTRRGEYELLSDPVGGRIDAALNERLLAVLSTKENVNIATLGFEDGMQQDYAAIVTPIVIAGERLGTLVVYRRGQAYDIDDIILCEYTTSVVGLEMLRSVNEENALAERKKQIVRSAIGTLSLSEQEAIVLVLGELEGREGLLVASKIADRAGITRSVIVNALKKFESAGVIATKSSGMKGTYIKVLNEVVFEELEQLE